MAKLLLELLITSLPVIFAAITHMIVVKLDWFSILKFPLDHYKMFREKRIFGPHKTYRGLVYMIVSSVIFVWIFYFLIEQTQFFQSYNLLDFKRFSPWFYGIVLGLGYILGELPNSFVKRQLDIIPGKSGSFLFSIIDQLDSIILINILLLIFAKFTFAHFFIGIIFYGLIHLIINILLYFFKLRKHPF
ncbi:MAG: CDP-archaeol synthase [Bacteroidales bacterium]|nr:CDP-archaeol synthase [Bacteroidales bacterium]